MCSTPTEIVSQRRPLKLVGALWRRHSRSDITRRFANGAFWSVVGTLISRGLMMAAAMIAARMVGQAAFGELGMIRCSVEAMGVLAGFGLGLTTTKHVAEFRQCQPVRAGRIVMLSCCMAFAISALCAIGLILFALPLAGVLLQSSHLSHELRIGGLLLCVTAVNGVQTGALAGFEAFRKIAAIQFVGGLTAFPLTCVGAWCLGVPGILYAMVFAVLVQCILNQIVLRAVAADYHVPLSLSGMFQETSLLWTFALPAAVSSALVGPVNWVCASMLVRQDDGFREFGAFTAANYWFMALLLLPTVASSAILPLLSSHAATPDGQSNFGLLKLAMVANAVVVIPIAVIGGVASPWIMRAYGSGFGEYWPVLLLTFATTIVLAMQKPMGQLIAASGRMWLGLALNLGWAFVFVVLTWLAIDWGATGLALSRLFAYSAHLVTTVYFLRHDVGGMRTASFRYQAEY